ncbi:MAG: UDP-N-acetylmuramate dehydrogenase [Candidatus Saganbacteria bacterium]|nr:UDP-N-acetylmuramate dehydrogenase [Candidatus Saganbacteria bacterium]
MRFQKKEPLKKHTSLRIGGPADVLCTPKSAADIIAALDYARQNKLKIAIIGAGSNLLVPETGFKGLVIKLGKGLNWLKLEKNSVRVGAGVMLPDLVVKAAKAGFSGLEFLAGIPGSVGGAVVMNAGAWGESLADHLIEVKALDRSGREKTFKGEELKAEYRSSYFQGRNWIIIEALLKLKTGNKKVIKHRILEHLTRRKSKQPLGTPNCGSVFRNPKNDFAGRLIEAAGCKGMRVGDAQVSTKHANFIVNLGEAKAEDVMKLMKKVRAAVRQRFKIRLEPEIKFMVKSST